MEGFERKVITSKGVRVVDEREFFLEVQEYIVNGWRIMDTGLRDDECLRNYYGNTGKVVVYKAIEDYVASVEEDKEEETDKVQVELGGPVKPIEVVVEDTLEEEVTPDLMVELEDLTKKADLIKFADKEEINIPSEMSNPASIKKFIRESLSE